jgi:hypothetical protein
VGHGADRRISNADAAVLLGVRSPATVRDLFEHGLLAGVRHADTVLVSRASVEELVGLPTLRIKRRVEEQVWLLLGEVEPS